MLFLCAAVVSTELKLTARPGHSSSLAVVAQVNDYKSFELEKCPLAHFGIESTPTRVLSLAAMARPGAAKGTWDCRAYDAYPLRPHALD
jgi:hypothetical protein